MTSSLKPVKPDKSSGWPDELLCIVKGEAHFSPLVGGDSANSYNVFGYAIHELYVGKSRRGFVIVRVRLVL